jgi:hypothetical protein
MTTAQIARALSANLPYAEVMVLARRAAPLLGLKITEFLRLRRNR